MSTFKIDFDKIDKNYRAGDTIYCTINLNFTAPTKFSCIYARFYGASRVSWSESDSSSSSSSSTSYYGDQLFFDHIEVLQGIKKGPEIQIQPGSYCHKVFFQLPQILPQAVNGFYGKIKYEVEVRMVIPWSFDKKEITPFHIVPELNLNDFPALKLPVEREASKTFGFFKWKSEPLHVKVSLPQQGFVAGNRTPCLIEINNNSDVAVEYISLTLEEVINNTATFPMTKTKRNYRIVWTFDLKDVKGGKLVQPLQKGVFKPEIFFDPTSTYTFLPNSDLIKVQYFLKVKPRVKGAHRNLENMVEITIGTIPFKAAAEALEEETKKISLNEPSKE